jgi:hypothetical protein
MRPITPPNAPHSLSDAVWTAAHCPLSKVSDSAINTGQASVAIHACIWNTGTPLIWRIRIDEIEPTAAAPTTAKKPSR